MTTPSEDPWTVPPGGQPYGLPGPYAAPGSAPTYGYPGPGGYAGPGMPPYGAPGYGAPGYGAPGYGAWGGPEPRNGLGVTGLVLGLVALVGSWLPFVGWVCALIALVGIVLGAIGVRRVRHGAATNRGVATWGLVVSVVALIATIALQIMWISALTYGLDHNPDMRAAASSYSGEL